MAHDATLTPATGIRGLWRAWDQFWFRPGDPTTLGFIRLVGGLMILYVHLVYSYDLQTLFGADAWLNVEFAKDIVKEAPISTPPPTWEKTTDQDLSKLSADQRKRVDTWDTLPAYEVGKGRTFFSLWYYLTDPVQMRIAHGIILLCMFFMAIGFCTRVTTVLSWIGMIFYINRSSVSVFGVDTMMNILAIYLMIGPSGAAYSVDRLIERWLAARRGKPIGPADLPAPSVSANLAIRLLQVHVCIVYTMSGLSKLQGSSWWNGMAAWGTMSNYEFSPLANHLYIRFLEALCAHRWVWEIVMMGGSWMTLLLECTYAFGIWNRKSRWLYLIALAIFHLNIAFFMGLVGFSIVMMVMNLCWIPGTTIRAFFASLRSQAPPSAQATSTLPSGRGKLAVSGTALLR